jgi:hypothetical protein
MTDTVTTNGHLSDDEARAAARQAWHASGGTLTGAELGQRYGRGARWGRNQRAAAQAEAAARGTAGGTAPRGPAAQPAPSAVAATRATAQPRAANRAAGPRNRPARQRSVERLRRAAVTAVALVAVGVAVLSYNHVVDLAERAQVGHPAWLVPLTLDGMVVAATCSLAVDWMTPGRRGELAAWFGASTGLAISMAANVIAVDPSLVPMEVVRWVGAGYPPLALAQAVHILARMPRAGA